MRIVRRKRTQFRHLAVDIQADAGIQGPARDDQRDQWFHVGILARPDANRHTLKYQGTPPPSRGGGGFWTHIPRRYERPDRRRPVSSAPYVATGPGISHRNACSISFSTFFVSTCGWPHGTLYCLQIARISLIADATVGCSYCRGCPMC